MFNELTPLKARQKVNEYTRVKPEKAEKAEKADGEKRRNGVKIGVTR
jgi:hypothetical protein